MFYVRLLLICLSFLIWNKEARAMIMISEILADPATSLSGDANNDGVSSSTQDEFIELFNQDGSSLDISGWKLKDAISVRHIFALNTIINPNQYLVVFGGGAPNLPGVYWKTASTGQLSLNNTSETVSLLDASDNVIDQVVYGSIGGHDQSIVKNGSEWVLHSSLSNEGKLFSPGTATNSEPSNTSTSAVPELPSGILLFLGMLSGLGLMRRSIKEWAKV